MGSRSSRAILRPRAKCVNFTLCKNHSLEPTMRTLRNTAAMLFALALALPLRSASAHPRLLSATPAADSRSADAPTAITLTFNEALDVALTRVTLHRGDTPIKLETVRLVAGNDKAVRAAVIGTLPPGRYTVTWQVTGDDGHPVRGSHTFEILGARAAGQPTSR